MTNDNSIYLSPKLAKVPNLEILSIATKEDSGAHPNQVLVKGADLDSVTAAIAELDAGRDKFTIVEAKEFNKPLKIPDLRA